MDSLALTFESLSNSALCTFRDCPYSFFLSYIRRLSPKKEAAYFMWGRLVHACLDANDREASVDEVIESFRQSATSSPIETQIEWEEMFATVPSVIEAYNRRYPNDRRLYESIMSETKFSMPLRTGHKFDGRIDRLVRDCTTGEICLWERKTPAQTGTSYYDGIHLDTQLLGYLLACRHVFGYTVTRVIYDVIKKPGGTKKKDPVARVVANSTAYQTNPTLFERTPLRFPEDLIEEHYQWLLDTFREIEQCAEDGRWIKHHSRGRKGGCFYLPLCTRGDDARNLYTVRNCVNPELAEE